MIEFQKVMGAGRFSPGCFSGGLAFLLKAQIVQKHIKSGLNFKTGFYRPGYSYKW